ncbi:MAG: molybdopterin molybdotransferase MoeA [Leptolyngbyaceae cyanobacterium CRU_2_3]|nr:molybdopterin molybdotransferase MoeA [Leptolyngbyaceae cyanobacterium CRU_2_3]
MLSAQQAEALILDLVQPLHPQRDLEILDLRSAPGRILATPASSVLDFPLWDNSAMDGYAVRYEDVKVCSTEQPAILEIVEEIPAGYQPQKNIQSGQAARILTGSMMPTGADTIVVQEETRRSGRFVTLFSAPKPHAFVRRQAEFYQAGQPLLPAGIRLSAAEIAVLATAQCTQVPVYRRPRIAILSTGSELVLPDQPLQPGQIVDSNQYALAALVASAGAEPICLGIVPDQQESLKAAIAQAISIADVVISSGGVSVGDYDYVDRTLTELRAEIHIRAVAVKPGRPLTVASFKATQSQEPELPHLLSPVLYFGLPGNPVSALVTFWRFVQPALRKLSGLADDWQTPCVEGRSLQDLRSDGKRETYLWGKTHLVQGKYEFSLAGGSQSSGNLINLAQTNSLAVIPIGQTLKTSGEAIQIMLVMP